MKKAVILDYQSLAPTDLDLSALWAIEGIDWQRYDYSSAQQTGERIRGANIILSNKVCLDATLLQQNPQLELIIILATGTNNVDLKAAHALNIRVCNIVAYSTESVVQHTFASLLALQSRLLDYDKAVKAGQWSKSQSFALLDFPIAEIAGKTLGIIGFGAIGKRVKQVAEAFNMKVMVSESLVPGADKDHTRSTLTELYHEADVISIHCPLSQYSENLIDAAAFKQMKPGAVLINVGRGGIVNEHALLEALEKGLIRGAATDVLTQEPPPENHILLHADIPNLIITPHTAWASREARQSLIQQVCEILTAHHKQLTLPNCVTGK